MGSKTVTLAPFLGYRGFNPLCESMRLYCVRKGRGCAWGQGHNWPLMRTLGVSSPEPQCVNGIGWYPRTQGRQLSSSSSVNDNFRQSLYISRRKTRSCEYYTRKKIRVRGI